MLTLGKVTNYFGSTKYFGKNVDIFCFVMTDQELLNKTFLFLQFTDQVNNRKDFAEKIGYDYSNLSNAFNGKERYLNSTLFSRIEDTFPGAMTKVQDQSAEYTIKEMPQSVLLLPFESRGGTIGDFAGAAHDYDCERVISPIRGIDYAMRVTGDSMSPEYPSGSVVLIKKVDEAAFIQWGEVYVLDTVNGPIIKQVRKTPDSGIVQCVSINPAYQPFSVCCEDINGWYKVLMVMTAK